MDVGGLESADGADTSRAEKTEGQAMTLPLWIVLLLLAVLYTLLAIYRPPTRPHGDGPW